MFDLSKIDVVEFLNELGMMKVKKNGDEITFSCPFGLHMRGGAISMRQGSTACHCFGCGFKGNAVTFLEELEGLNSKEALKWIQDRWDINRKIPDNHFRSALVKKLQRSEEKRKNKKFAKKKTSNVLPMSELYDREFDWFSVENIGEHNDATYLLDRGFSAKTLMDWNIGFDEEFYGFTIPYFDHEGNLVGFKARAIGDRVPRYKVLGGKRYNFEPVNVSNFLFGQNMAKDYDDLLIVCEGELNCIKLHQNGFINSVGISGKHISKEQEKLIRKMTKSVFFIFDELSDEIKAAKNLYKDMPVFIADKHIKDPADSNYEELKNLINSPLRFHNYEISKLTSS